MQKDKKISKKRFNLMRKFFYSIRNFFRNKRKSILVNFSFFKEKFDRYKSITGKQLKYLRRFDCNDKRAIVFLIPGVEDINGGTMSIFSLCSQTRKLRSIHDSVVLLSSYPGGDTYYENTKFPNKEIIVSFSMIRDYFLSLDSIILHIPEYACYDILNGLSKSNLEFLRKIQHVHINIMNQNIELMPEPGKIDFIRGFCNKLTQTTAHNRYCTKEFAMKYNMPVHLFSVFIESKQYFYSSWEEKDDIIVISPDPHPLKNRIMDTIKIKMPSIRQVIVENLTYLEYKKLISKAKYAVTFGEGFDGYYLEPFFSGSFSFTVYNDLFFPTEEFKDFFGVYGDYESMEKKICDDINLINSQKNLRDISFKEIHDKICSFYSFDSYKKNIELFYQQKYTHNND
jgi:hypothetical protein